MSGPDWFHRVVSVAGGRGDDRLDLPVNAGCRLVTGEACSDHRSHPLPQAGPPCAIDDQVERDRPRVGLDFRATKDLDIVLVVEALDSAFASRFWAFVEEGDYEIRESSESAKVLYRFQKPKAEGYPAMLELFSRAPEGLTLGGDAHLTPLPIDEAAASLSAILLDESYYEFLKSMVREAGGIPVLD